MRGAKLNSGKKGCANSWGGTHRNEGSFLSRAPRPRDFTRPLFPRSLFTVSLNRLSKRGITRSLATTEPEIETNQSTFGNVFLEVRNGSHFCWASNFVVELLFVFFNPLTPVPPVTALDEPWPFFHLYSTSAGGKDLSNAYNIRLIKKYLSRESTERLFHAFITSRLDYCNGFLYGVPEYQVKKLQRVMNASARLVYLAPKYCHITPFLRELHWLPVRLRVDFKTLLITFKILHGVAPSYLKDLVSVLPDSHYQLGRNNNGILLERPRLRTKKTMGDRAFSIAAPFLWNSLPLPIRQETSIDSSKRSVKTFI